ncbi:MAG TPA: PAS domain-containing protein [Caulobacteraceae bacterium]|jgi:hypothetical protein
MVMQFGAQAAAARAHEELFAYWASRREGGRLPSRGAIRPEHFKRHLPMISLIDVSPSPRAYRIRLAGTGLYGLYGREITGRTLEQVYPETAADYWRRELDQVVETRRPAVGMHSFAWRGAPHLSVLWLRLPLSADGAGVDMILGYDAPLGSRSDLHHSGIRAA